MGIRWEATCLHAVLVRCVRRVALGLLAEERRQPHHPRAHLGVLLRGKVDRPSLRLDREAEPVGVRAEGEPVVGAVRAVVRAVWVAGCR